MEKGGYPNQIINIVKRLYINTKIAYDIGGVLTENRITKEVR